MESCPFKNMVSLYLFNLINNISVDFTDYRNDGVSFRLEGELGLDSFCCL